VAAQATSTAAFTGVSNVTYDLLTMLTNKLKCVAAAEQYKRDAEQTADDDVVLVIARIERHARADVAELRRLLSYRI
jgi:hypothetical protein